MQKTKNPVRQFLLISTAVLGLTVAHSQTTFQKIYGGQWQEIAYSVQQNNDGGFFIVGGSGSFCPGNNDIYAIRTDITGDTLWTKSYGGTNGDWGHYGKQTSDGGFIIAGETSSFGTDILLLKIKSDGSLQWAKNYGGSSVDVPFSVDLTNDGGYVICGKTWGFGLGNICLIKTDSLGNLNWYKAYGDNDAIGGFSAHQTNDKGYIFLADLIGYTGTYVIKTDSLGNVLWGRKIQGNLTYGKWVEQTSDNGYIITGNTSAFGSGFQDAYLCKLDPNGNFQWAKAYGTWDSEFGTCVLETYDGDFIVTGTCIYSGNDQIYLFRTDSIGNLRWAKCYGNYKGADEAYSVIETNDKGFAITGYDQVPAGLNKVFLYKTDSLGVSGCTDTLFNTTVMSFTPTITNKNPTVNMGLPPNNPNILTCNTSTNVETLLMPKANFSTWGDSTLFVHLCDSSFNIVSCIWNFGDSSYDSSFCPNHLYADTGIYTVCLTVQNNCGKDSICKTIIVPSTISSVSEYVSLVHVFIFPNPFSSQTTLQTNDFFHNATLTVDNCFGQTVAQIKNISGQTITFNRDNLASGLYFVRLTADNKVFVDKLLITDK